MGHPTLGFKKEKGVRRQLGDGTQEVVWVRRRHRCEG